MTKAELRQVYREKRSSLTAIEISDASRGIAEIFFETMDLTSVKSLSTFIRIARFNEIDTSAVYYRLWRDHPWIRIFAPKADVETGNMSSIALFPDTPLTENRWGIREPLDGEAVAPDELDLVIVPLLAVDPAGHRVGYGKGFYDRFLSECRADCIKVGLNYFPPLAESISAELHDIALDICVTPNDVYRF